MLEIKQGLAEFEGVNLEAIPRGVSTGIGASVIDGDYYILTLGGKDGELVAWAAYSREGLETLIQAAQRALNYGKTVVSSKSHQH